MIHLHAVTQPRQNAVLVPMTPDEHALEIGRMILGTHHKSGDLWSHPKVLMAVQEYFERLGSRMDDLGRNTDDAERATRFSDVADSLADDAIPGLQSFLDDQLEAGRTADRYQQRQDVARKLNQDEKVMG